MHAKPVYPVWITFELLNMHLLNWLKTKPSDCNYYLRCRPIMGLHKLNLSSLHLNIWGNTWATANMWLLRFCYYTFYRTFVPPQLWGDIAVSSVVRDGDGQNVTDVWGWLGGQSQFYGVPHNPKRILRYLVLIVHRAWLQLCVRGHKIRR